MANSFIIGLSPKFELTTSTELKFLISKNLKNVKIVPLNLETLIFCKINKLNFICFKFISDNADDDAGQDWSKAFKKGAKEFSLFFQKEYEGIKI